MRAGTRPTPPEPPGSRSVNAGSRTPFRQTDRHPGRSTAVGGRVSPLPRQRRRVAAVSHRTVGPRPLPAIRIPDWGRRSAGNSATRRRRSSHVPPGTGRNPAAPRHGREPRPSGSAGPPDGGPPIPAVWRLFSRPHPGRRPARVPQNQRRARKVALPARRPAQARMGARDGQHAPAMRNPDRGATDQKAEPSPEPNSVGPEGPTEFPESFRHRFG